MNRATWMALVVALLPVTARAQQPAVAPAEPLQQLVADQERRLKALESQVAALQATIQALRSQAGLAPPPDVPAEVLRAAEEAPAVTHAVSGESLAQIDPKPPEADLPVARPIQAYGSLRLASVVNTDGVSDIRNNSSRVGLRGEKALGPGLTAFARLELGVNLVANDRTILETGDPGAPIGQGSQAFSSRLGFIGLATRAGSVSWGKQWSPYYDVAEFTDQLQLFGGAASGAFGAGTDGGLAGTGRAERSVQYRKRVGLVSIGMQVQNRATSPNDQGWLDTWGGAVVVGQREGFAAAAAYNEVRDGVANPNPNQSQLGDKAALFGVRYRSGSWYGAATFSILTQHEVDDRGRRFDGHGLELALVRDFGSRVWLEVGFNDLQPDSDHPGQFRVRFGLANVVYQFGDASRVFAGVKVDGGRASDGTPRPRAVFAGGLRYNF
jgi:predicted porin